MRELEADLWSVPADAIVISTNGTVKKDGTAVMGRGCAREAALRFNQVPRILGRKLQEHGNQVQMLFGMSREDPALISFPVKHNWWEDADPDLIRHSLVELTLLADQLDFYEIAMPRQGCGNGQLDWNDVRPLLVEVLDERFTVVHLEGK